MSAATAVRNVGVRDPQPRQDRDLQSLHGGGLSVGLVIVAAQMQKAMYRQMDQMMSKRLVLGCSFARQRLIGDDDVAEETLRLRLPPSRKGQHVGRLVLAPPAPVEPANGRIIGKHNSNLGSACCGLH